MKNFNLNISSLFSGLGSNNSAFGSFNFSDYAYIKNCSYAKLTKSYFTKDKVETKKNNVDKTEDKKTSKIDTKDTTGLSKMKKESDALATSVKALDKADLWTLKDGKYDKDKIAEAVKSFVNEYNDTIAQSSKVTNSDVSKQISNMESMTGIMSKNLSKIGVTVSADGKLAVNEDTLKGANVKDIKSMFDGANSYASQIQKYASDISKAAVNGSSIYSADGTLTSALQGTFNDWM